MDSVEGKSEAGGLGEIDGFVIDKLVEVGAGDSALLDASLVIDGTEEDAVEFDDSLSVLEAGVEVEQVAAVGAGKEGIIHNVLPQDHIEGRLGVEEEDKEGGVGDMERVEDTLSEQDAGEVMGGTTEHEFGGGTGRVPVLPGVIHDPKVQGFTEKRTTGNRSIASGFISGLAMGFVENDGPGTVDLR